jgi:hypothetical protein
MNRQDRIEVNPKILVGKPVIKGTRLPVEFILELLAELPRAADRVPPQAIRKGDSYYNTDR